jgi:hypothetical protein
MRGCLPAIRKRVTRLDAELLSRKRLELQIGQLAQQVGELDVHSRPGMETGQGGIEDEGQVSRDTTGPRLASLRQRYADM